MALIPWRKWKKTLTNNPRWCCPACGMDATRPHKCEHCGCKASEDPALCSTFIKKQGNVYPIFERIEFIELRSKR